MSSSVSAELKIARETTIGSVGFNLASWTAIGKLVLEEFVSHTRPYSNASVGRATR